MPAASSFSSIFLCVACRPLSLNQHHQDRGQGSGKTTTTRNVHISSRIYPLECFERYCSWHVYLCVCVSYVALLSFSFFLGNFQMVDRPKTHFMFVYSFSLANVIKLWHSQLNLQSTFSNDNIAAACWLAIRHMGTLFWKATFTRHLFFLPCWISFTALLQHHHHLREPTYRQWRHHVSIL